jgi:hypothetical protein
MLGVLIADEIKQIDREKNHQCAACQTNQTNRAIRVFVARNDCVCPVCETAKDRIQGMGKKLDKLCDALNLEHQRIDPFINSAIFLAEHEQDIRNVAGLEGGVTYAARVIQGLIRDYDALIEAAHHREQRDGGLHRHAQPGWPQGPRHHGAAQPRTPRPQRKLTRTLPPLLSRRGRGQTAS